MGGRAVGEAARPAEPGCMPADQGLVLRGEPGAAHQAREHEAVPLTALRRGAPPSAVSLGCVSGLCLWASCPGCASGRTESLGGGRGLQLVATLPVPWGLGGLFLQNEPSRTRARLRCQAPDTRHRAQGIGHRASAHWGRGAANRTRRFPGQTQLQLSTRQGEGSFCGYWATGDE